MKASVMKLPYKNCQCNPFTTHFQHISHLVIVFVLLTLNMYMLDGSYALG